MTPPKLHKPRSILFTAETRIALQNDAYCVLTVGGVPVIVVIVVYVRLLLKQQQQQ